jgi:hypothetical protein
MRGSRNRTPSCCLPRLLTRRHPESDFFRGSMAGLHVPLPTLRRHPRGCQRTARGRCDSLSLHRNGLSPPTLCRSVPAHNGSNRFLGIVCSKVEPLEATLRRVLREELRSTGCRSTQRAPKPPKHQSQTSPSRRIHTLLQCRQRQQIREHRLIQVGRQVNAHVFENRWPVRRCSSSGFRFSRPDPPVGATSRGSEQESQEQRVALPRNCLQRWQRRTFGQTLCLTVSGRISDTRAWHLRVRQSPHDIPAQTAANKERI